MTEALPAGHAHVWTLLTTPRPTGERLSALQALLSDDECARAARFHFPRDTATFVQSHALVRTVLSNYAAVPPEAWRFRANEHGCPFVDDRAHAWLRFNLSHTDGCAVVAVARGADVGVDVESLSRRPVDLEVARRYFAGDELAALLAAPEGERHRVFLELWTLKEAYIKARGIGLSLGLHDFTCRRGMPASIAFAPALDDRAEAWHLEQFAPSAEHVAAIAVRREAGRAVRVDVRQAFL